MFQHNSHVIGVLIVAVDVVKRQYQPLHADIVVAKRAFDHYWYAHHTAIHIVMAPGPFSGLLAPFIGARKSKKYEKLQTEDPEKKRQEATQEEINRLHNKIVSTNARDDGRVHARDYNHPPCLEN